MGPRGVTAGDDIIEVGLDSEVLPMRRGAIERPKEAAMRDHIQTGDGVKTT